MFKFHNFENVKKPKPVDIQPKTMNKMDSAEKRLRFERVNLEINRITKIFLCQSCAPLMDLHY